MRLTAKMSGAHPRPTASYPVSFWGVRPLYRLCEESGLYRVHQLNDPLERPQPALANTLLPHTCLPMPICPPLPH